MPRPAKRSPSRRWSVRSTSPPRPIQVHRRVDTGREQTPSGTDSGRRIDVPEIPRLVADDVTPEAVASLLAEQTGRIAVISAEGGVFDIIAGRYNGNIPNMDVWLKGHSGDMIRVDRKGRPPEYIRKPALTLGLMIQPEVLKSIAAQRAFRGRGLIARFLYALPVSQVGYRKTGAPPLSETVRTAYDADIRSSQRVWRLARRSRRAHAHPGGARRYRDDRSRDRTGATRRRSTRRSEGLGFQVRRRGGPHRGPPAPRRAWRRARADNFDQRRHGVEGRRHRHLLQVRGDRRVPGDGHRPERHRRDLSAGPRSRRSAPMWCPSATCIAPASRGSRRRTYCWRRSTGSSTTVTCCRRQPTSKKVRADRRHPNTKSTPR